MKTKKMTKIFKLISLLLMVLFLSSTIANAEREVFVDKNFDFSSVDTVFIAEPEITEDRVSDIKKRELTNIYFKEFSKKFKSIDVITPDTLNDYNKSKIDLVIHSHIAGYFKIAHLGLVAVRFDVYDIRTYGQENSVPIMSVIDIRERDNKWSYNLPSSLEKMYIRIINNFIDEFAKQKE